MKVHPGTDQASDSGGAPENVERDDPGTESSAGSPTTTTTATATTATAATKQATATKHTTATKDTTGRLGGRGWAAAIRRSVREFGEDGLQDRAAALTYYGIQSIFPGLLVLVSLLGLLGVSATQRLITNLANAAPASVRHVVKTALVHLQHHHATAGILAVAGIVLGLWSASKYVGAFMRASNVIYDVPEGRPFWKTTPIRLAVTLAMLVLLVVSALIVVVTGGLATRVGHALGIGSAAVTAWDIAKWPVLLVIVSIMFAILYWASPNARHGFRWLSAGSVLAVAAWLVCSGLFAVYLAYFGHYDKVYSSLGGVIIFLIWMWISNVAILMGAELDAELERGRAIAGGHPPEKEPFARLRDTRRLRARLTR